MTDPRFIEANGVSLAVFERAGATPPVLFAHATSFHARAWNQVIASIPKRQILAFDMRGHGLSSKPNTAYRWRQFGEDSEALVRGLALRGATGVGHSMGGHSLAFAAAVAPEAFAELILIEPVIMPRAMYTGRAREPHYARKRRSHWTSPEEMFERFKGRPPFRDWDPVVLRDYCEYGLVPSATGEGYDLACTPETEASIYEASTLADADIYDQLDKVEASVTVVRAPRFMPDEGPMDMSASLTAPDLAAHFRHGRDIVVEHSHFIPMEAPGLVAELVNESAANAGA